MGSLEIPGPPDRPNLLIKMLLELSSAGAVGGLSGYSLMGPEGAVIGVVISIPIWFGGKLIGYTRIFSSGREYDTN